jgi:hypothetical protein
MSSAASYYYDRTRFAASIWIALGVGAAFLFVGALSGLLWVGAAAAGICGMLAIWTAVELTRPGPILSVTPTGLTYRPFSTATIDWSNVESITLMRHERLVSAWGKGSYIHEPNLDAVNVVLRDFAPYPRSIGRSISRSVSSVNGRPAIVIQLYFLKSASSEAITEALARHWKGEIQHQVVRRQG